MPTMTQTANEPRTEHIVETAGGRKIAVAEFGAADGPVVLLLHRSPGSRLFDPDPVATAAAGVRLVTMDRPGYGVTDPVEAPSRAAAADAAVGERPGVADALVAMTVESARQGGEGMAFDIVAGSLHDPFPFADINVPVHLFHGDADQNVGREHLDWWAERLPNAERRVLADTGHLLAVSHWGEILRAARG